VDELEVVRHMQIEGLSIFFDTVDYRTPHFHPDRELIWVIDNPLRVRCGQNTSVINPGELAFFNPNMPHEFHKLERESTFLCIQASPELFSSIRGAAVDDIFPAKWLSSDECSTIKQMCADAARAYLNNSQHYELYCVGTVALIFHKLLGSMPTHTLTAEEEANLSRRNARLSRLIKFVDTGYMHKIRLSDFAEAEGCSMSYMSHFVKDALNQTFQEYVNSVRFNCACKLMTSESRKLLDICMESGFSDYRYFSRTFREQCGMTPEEYRKNAGHPAPHNPAVRHSLHSLERFYTREESIELLDRLIK